MKLVAIVVLIFTLTGCGSMWARAMQPDPPNCGMFFGGVVVDTTEFMQDTSDPLVVAGGVLDLPFSFVTDIVFSPYDFYQLHQAHYVYCTSD